MRISPSEQRLETLEQEFQPLLIACLKECAAERRWGLFEQNPGREAKLFLHWDEATRLKEIAEEIHEIRAEFGQPNETCERFLKLCSEHGQNLPGEPKRAAKFLSLLGIDW
jgi:hypothetical protein